MTVRTASVDRRLGREAAPAAVLCRGCSAWYSRAA